MGNRLDQSSRIGCRTKRKLAQFGRELLHESGPKGVEPNLYCHVWNVFVTQQNFPDCPLGANEIAYKAVFMARQHKKRGKI